MQEPGAPGATIRRRGADLLRAIYLATLTELAETSFEELGFDRIAARAGTGKTSLYRRWNSTVELVLDALTDPASGFAEPVVPDTGTLRSDLIEALRDFASALQLPHGQALRPLMTQRPRHPELYAEVLRRVVRPRMVAVLAVLRVGADRGEVRPDAVTPRIASLGLRLVVSEHMDTGAVGDTEIRAIVDEIVLPLTEPR